ncbi:MAG TPA: adenylate/guanylate cyclase domain-containing protein [Candidatus Limnocylindrales bacterium]
MICRQCGTPNADERRFCLECGSPLASGCPVCGSANEAGAKFCGTCGNRLAPTGSDVSAAVAEVRERAAFASPTAPRTAPPTPPPTAPPTPPPTAGHGPAAPATTPTGAERRLVTVLFADLVGFTTLSADRDPEAVRELLGRYFERSREIIARYGGTVEKFIGDAVMAVWGTPVAHEDDAERGVRAALELVDAVPVLGREAGLELQVRAGVLSGEAAVTLGATDQGMVAGDLVNTASRLQSVAAPGTVLAGEATRAAAESAIVFEPAGDQVLKGKVAPVAAWRAVRVVGERGGAGRTDGLEPPFVGRMEELRFLKEQFHATGRERRARLVSLVGQGGIGKSRLAWELEKYLDGVVETVWWHRGRSPSYGEGVTFWALGEMIRRRAGLAEGDDEQATRRGIESMLADHVASPEERAWIGPRLLVLLGVGEMPSGGREELFAAWRTFFERLAAERTVALVFEDLQWADDGLLDFLEHLLDWARTHPIYVLTLARPELLERRPGWGADRRGAISMRLEPLSDLAMRELLEGIAPGLPASAVERILERADGIPLYAVETVRMLVANGGLVRQDGRLVPVGDLRDLDVPPTLHALVAARLDALPAPDRALLQDAAVLGQSFTLAALAALSGETEATLGPRLASLVRREVLTVETDPRAPTRGQHSFVQALLREVAYGTLARRDRRSRHLAAARYFESIGDEELAGVLATHYVSAYRAAPDGPEGEAVAAQARIALLGAADRAEALGALGQAAASIRAAMEVTPDDSARAGLLERIGWLETAASRHDEAAATLESAIAAYASLGDDIGLVRASARAILGHLSTARLSQATAIVDARRDAAAALAGRPDAGEALAVFDEAVARTAFRYGRWDEAIEWADRAVALAEPLRLDEVITMGLTTKGSALYGLGRRREGLAILHGVVVDARERGLHTSALRASVNLASFTTDSDPRSALARVKEGLDLARHLGIRSFDWYLMGNATVAARVGEWEWLRSAARELLELDPDRFEAAWIGATVQSLDAWTDAADFDTARRFRAEAVAQNEPQNIGNMDAWLVTACYATGRDDEALVHAADLLDHPYGGWFWETGIGGRVALRRGDRALFERCLARLAGGPGGAVDIDHTALRACAAAADGRTAEALTLFRSSIDAYRERGLRFDVALAGLAMAEALPVTDATVRAAVDDARAIATELGATRVLERLNEAAAREDVAV